jgi:putative FmdB family regulatory protein
MPIYEYQCHDCGCVMEVLVSSSKALKPVCKNCQSKKVLKKMSDFAVGQAHPSHAACEGCPSGGMCDPGAMGGCPGGGCMM